MGACKALVVIFLLGVIFPADAMNVRSYRELLANSPESAENYIVGVFQGIHWANSFNILDGGNPLYCPPGKLVMNTGNIKRIVDDELSIAPDVYTNISPIEAVLYKGLQRTFPCR